MVPPARSKQKVFVVVVQQRIVPRLFVLDNEGSQSDVNRLAKMVER